MFCLLVLVFSYLLFVHLPRLPCGNRPKAAAAQKLAASQNPCLAVLGPLLLFLLLLLLSVVVVEVEVVCCCSFACFNVERSL